MHLRPLKPRISKTLAFMSKPMKVAAPMSHQPPQPPWERMNMCAPMPPWPWPAQHSLTGMLYKRRKQRSIRTPRRCIL